jgi:hypothetical protein
MIIDLPELELQIAIQSLESLEVKSKIAVTMLNEQSTSQK